MSSSLFFSSLDTNLERLLLSFALVLGLSIVSSESTSLCHVDINRFSGKATSVGSWAGIDYHIVYSQGTCTSDSPEGSLWAELNGVNQSVTAREGQLLFDGLARVHFSVTGGETEAQLFSSSLCWTNTNCTPLCVSSSLGIKGPCTVEKTIMPTMMVTLWLIPAIACGGFLLVLYARKRHLERQQALEAIRTPRRMTGPSFPASSDQDEELEETEVSVRVEEPGLTEVEINEAIHKLANSESMDRVSIITEEDVSMRSNKKIFEAMIREIQRAEVEADEQQCRYIIEMVEKTDRENRNALLREDELKVTRGAEEQRILDQTLLLFKNEADARQQVEEDEDASLDLLMNTENIEKNNLKAMEEEKKNFEDALQNLLESETVEREVIEEEQDEAMDTLVDCAVEDCDAISKEELQNFITSLEKEERDERSAIEKEAEECLNNEKLKLDEALREEEKRDQLAKDLQDVMNKEEEQREATEEEEAKERDALLSKLTQEGNAIAEKQLNDGIKSLEKEERDERSAIEKEAEECLNNEKLKLDEALREEEKRDQLAKDLQDVMNKEEEQREATEEEEAKERDALLSKLTQEGNAIAEKQLNDGIKSLEKEERDERSAIEKEAEECLNNEKLKLDEALREEEKRDQLAKDLQDVMNKEEEQREATEEEEAKERDALLSKLTQEGNAIAEKQLNDGIKSLEKEERDERSAIEKDGQQEFGTLTSQAVNNQQKLFSDERTDLEKEEERKRGTLSNNERREFSDIAKASQHEKEAVENVSAIQDLMEAEAISREKIEEEEKSARSLVSAKQGAGLRRAKAAEAERKAAQVKELVNEEESERKEVDKEQEKEFLSLQDLEKKDYEDALEKEEERALEDVLAATRTYNYTDEYKELMKQKAALAKDMPPAPPFIGFSLAEVVEEGVLVVDGLYKDGPAYQTGIRIGDKLLRIEGIEVRTINDAREVVNRRCRCGRVTPITLISPENKQYTVALWIMTADRQYMDQPFFFDVRKHERIESQVKKQ